MATACGLSSVAGAVTIDFDTLASSTPLGDQYLAEGAQFVGVFTVVSNTFAGALTVPSPPNYVQVGEGSQTVRFVDPANPAYLATTTSVTVDTPALSAGCFDAIEISAYDVHHNLLDSAATPAFAAGGSATSTTVSGAGIHTVKMTRLVGACIAPFDNLTFDDVVVSDTIFFDGFEPLP